MKKLPALLLLLALCMTLTACWEADGDEPDAFWEAEPVPSSDETSRKSAPEPERETVFTLPYLNSQTLDPVACSDGVQQTVGSLLYEGLFALDARFVPQPVLCSSYNCSSNGLTYTFWMREDAAFSNGVALSATDVLATYRRAQASERYAAGFSNVASMRVNRGALVVTLRTPDSGFPALLDIPVVKSGTEKDTVPLGTGPYLFLTDEEGPCLMRKEYWWGETDYPLERIALVPAKDADTAIYHFSANNAHLLMADLLSETPASSLGGIDMTDVPTTTLLFLGFNTKKSPLDRSELRIAMGEALDRDAIVTTLLAGHATAAQFPICPASPLYPAALETAYENAAYLRTLSPADVPAEAAAPPPAAVIPQEPVELTLLVNEENSFKVALAEYLARQLSQGQVSVTPTVLPWPEYLAALESGSFDLWLGEVRLTADWDCTALVSSGGALNYGGYANPELDKALTAFLADETAQTAEAFCTVLAADAPILPLVFKSASMLTPVDAITGMAPIVNHPFANLEDWSFHLNT